MDESKSNSEIAMEFIANHPELTERLTEEMFPTFWEHPELVIKCYDKTIYQMKTSFGFTDEMVKEHCLNYLADSCDTVKTQLNLNPNFGQIAL